MKRPYTSNLIGFYSTEIYLPVSVITDFLRGVSRNIRQKSDAHEQHTSLPVVQWKTLLGRKPIFICEREKSDGNIRLSELGILCQFARRLPENGMVFEIGTFDGRTTLNLALNSPSCQVTTLDLLSGSRTRLTVEPGEKVYIEKPLSGKRFLQNSEAFPDAVNRITQLFGDSAEFDFSSYEGRFDLVFVDGSHAYEYVLKDSETALRLRNTEGIIIWHDYGVWEGVTRALEELEERTGAGLYHIYGTSLVVCL
ncbi:MAG: class I SAM-dependent methyltransferase [Thermodesulfobacteriota bacterium]